MTSVSTEVDWPGGGGGGEGGMVGIRYRMNAFRVLRFEPGVVHFLLCERSKLQRLGQKLQDKASSLFF